MLTGFHARGRLVFSAPGSPVDKIIHEHSGKMVELKRTQEEKEVRMRGGNSIDSITPQLDYLVIGSIPSPSWKNGDYSLSYYLNYKIMIK